MIKKGKKRTAFLPGVRSLKRPVRKKNAEFIAGIKSESYKDAVRRKSEVMRTDTEKLLKELFDFQRFERDPCLGSVIDEVMERFSGVELSEDDLDTVSAAGDPYSGTRPPGKREGPE